MTRKWTSLLAGSLIMVFLIAGCGGGGEEQAQQTTQQQQPELDPASFGSVSVTVNYEGEQPEGNEVYAGANPECETETIMQYPINVNDNGTLRNVVVSVKQGPDGLAQAGEQSSEMPVVDQDHCEYVPHVFTVKAGQTFKVTNSDPGMHNVRATTDGNQLFNKTTMQDDSFETSFDDPGVYSLVCNIHPWMQNWTYVTSHGKASVTGEQGEATISDLPPGDYTFSIWHEKLGTKSESITLSEKQEASLSVSFSGQ